MDKNNNAENPTLTFVLTTLATHPVILEVDGFIDPEICDHIIALSEPHMKTSTVSHMHNTKGASNQWRTSSTYWLRRGDPRVDVINKHTASLTHIPLSHQEQVQVCTPFSFVKRMCEEVSIL